MDTIDNVFKKLKAIKDDINFIQIGLREYGFKPELVKEYIDKKHASYSYQTSQRAKFIKQLYKVENDIEYKINKKNEIIDKLNTTLNPYKYGDVIIVNLAGGKLNDQAITCTVDECMWACDGVYTVKCTPVNIIDNDQIDVNFIVHEDGTIDQVDVIDY